MPLYIERDNNIAYRPPYVQKDAFLSIFPVSSPRSAQQAILDKELNALANGTPYRYTAHLDYVALILADMKQVHSEDQTSGSLGWLEESDVCWWILAAAEKDGKVDHFVWYIPYIWVNSVYAMVTGREVVGFPKSLASMHVPKDEHDLDGPFWAEAPVVLAPDSKVKPARILDVTRSANAPRSANSAAGEASSVRDILTDALEFRFDKSQCPIELFKKFLSQLLSGAMPGVYLKQFRDIVDPQSACYQAIIETNFTVTRFHGAGSLPTGFEVRTHPMASVNVGQSLALGPGTNVSFGFWAKLDFTVDLGSVLWPLPLKTGE
ncbi:acetoacetate decarboxylase family protein [Sorangium cellulosum]|uniref:acetoacetate decarboxylase family protein n=1 Tax=Sorangium cellulosum TaxID=56 RepID=UPI003D9A3728